SVSLSALAVRLTLRIEELIAAIPAAHPADRGPGPGIHVSDPTSAQLSGVARLAEITGGGGPAAHPLIGEDGPDMAQFPTTSHLVSSSKVCPRTIQSGPKRRSGNTGSGNP